MLPRGKAQDAHHRVCCGAAVPALTAGRVCAVGEAYRVCAHRAVPPLADRWPAHTHVHVCAVPLLCVSMMMTCVVHKDGDKEKGETCRLQIREQAPSVPSQIGCEGQVAGPCQLDKQRLCFSLTDQSGLCPKQQRVCHKTACVKAPVQEIAHLVRVDLRVPSGFFFPATMLCVSSTEI
jgi:hypothetical protein